MTDSKELSEQEISEILEAKGCMYRPEQGYHFVGISGKHLSGYYNVDPALPDVNFIAQMTKQLVKPFQNDHVDTVFVPAIGAIPMAQWGPFYLEQLTGKPVLGVWADKVKPRGFVIERNGFAEAISGKKILILEDIVNQMFSVKELVRIARELGGDVVGVGGLMVKNTASAKEIGVPKLERMHEFYYDAWEPADCELCRRNIPIVTDPALGHGYEYQEQHPEYEGGYTLIEEK
jgi:orotate phosphoribosyltransferase